MECSSRDIHSTSALCGAQLGKMMEFRRRAMRLEDTRVMSEPTNSAIERIRCKDAAEFLGRISPTHPMWGSDGLESKWLFRGHRNFQNTLLPSAWRRDPIKDRKLLEFREFLVASGYVDNQLKSINVDDGLGLSSEAKAQWLIEVCT